MTAALLLMAAIMWPEEPAPPRRPAPGLFITVYDWALGGQNCDGDCSNTALTTTGPELYGWTAACPSAWLGHVATTVVTIWGQEYVPPGDWTTRREWMTTFNELREVRR